MYKRRIGTLCPLPWARANVSRAAQSRSRLLQSSWRGYVQRARMMSEEESYRHLFTGCRPWPPGSELEGAASLQSIAACIRVADE